ncbi:hypothetical protein MXB_2788 [Myxobolus squamalis]|nr:hypothetical protein MXB_2788 [Myxobolus squamalis]
MSICVSCSEKAGKIIKDVVKKGELKVINKVKILADSGEFDPQTEADRLSQLCIIGKLKECFPKMKVIGEEGDFKGHYPKSTYDDIEPNISVLKTNCPVEYYKLTEENVVVWVDPLDGTSGFTKGVLHQVVVSLGIATIEGIPIAGVLHQPYCTAIPFDSPKDVENYSKSHPRTVWGIHGVGLFGLDSRLRFRKADSVALISKFHYKDDDFQLAKAIEVEQIITGSGAAYKGLCVFIFTSLKVLENEADVLLYSSGGTKKWDICAIDVFFKIMGGKLTDIHGRDYNYSPKTEYNNTFGVLAALKNYDIYLNKLKNHMLS